MRSAATGNGAPRFELHSALGLIETKDMRRFEEMEIKHGRIAMAATLHVPPTRSDAVWRFRGAFPGKYGMAFSFVTNPQSAFTTRKNLLTCTRLHRMHVGDRHGGGDPVPRVLE